MQPKFYTFGDSYLCGAPNDSVYAFRLSKKYRMTSDRYETPGNCNLQIFSSFLDNLYKFKKDDFILFSWSFVIRGSFVNKNQKLESLNTLYDNEGNDNEDVITSLSLQDKNHLLTHYLKYSYDTNYKLFKYQLIPLLKFLDTYKIKYINIFARRDDLYFGNNQYPIFPEIPNTILFEGDDLVPFLMKKKWHTEETGHYSYGIQDKLLDIVHSQVKKYYLDLDI